MVIIPTYPRKNSWSSPEPLAPNQDVVSSQLRSKVLSGKAFPQCPCDLAHEEDIFACRRNKLAQEIQDQSLICFPLNPTPGCPGESPGEKREEEFLQNESHRPWVGSCRLVATLQERKGPCAESQGLCCSSQQGHWRVTILPHPDSG